MWFQNKIKPSMICAVARACRAVSVMVAVTAIYGGTAQAQTITIRYASPESAGTITQEAITWFIEEVTQRSGGKIRFEQFLGSSLVKDQDLLDAVGDGVVDMGKIFTISYPGQMPLYQLANIPFTHPSPGVLANSIHALEVKYPAFAEEMRTLNLRAFGLLATGGTQIVSRKPIGRFEDLKGLKVRARGVQGAAFVAAGAAPVSIPWNDVYEALSKGVVEASTNYILSMRGVRHNEVADYFTSVDLGQALQMEIINLEFWQSLPADAQALLTTVMKQAEARYVAEGAKRAIAERALMESKEGGGVKFSRLPQADIEKWQQISPDFVALWAKQVRVPVDTAAIAADFVALQQQFAQEAERSQQVGMW